MVNRTEAQRATAHRKEAKRIERRSRADLEELMLTGGVEILEDNGIEASISSLSYVRVFEHLQYELGIRVTYGSVHERIWSSLAHYQFAVLERAGIWAAESDDDEWVNWVRAAIALASQAGPVNEAAVEANRKRYTALDKAAAETADSKVEAQIAVAVREGLKLRETLTGKPTPPAVRKAAANL